MAVPESVESGGTPGTPTLFTSLRSFWGVLVAILYTRLDLLTVELEEEAKRAVQLVMVSVATLLCISMAVFFLMFFLIALFWEHRLIVLGIVFGFYVLASVILFFVARSMVLSRPRFLSQTLAELHRDVEGLHPAAKAPEAKP
ncbi:MAG TPA: phage holin family protein [Candidatus Methylacidiphilales bacterium]